MSALELGDGGMGLGGNILLKRRMLIYFALNLLLVGPYILTHYSLIGCGLSGAILLVMFIFTVIRPDKDELAVRNLPLMFFLDACVPLVLAYRELRYAFTVDNIEYLIDVMVSKGSPLLLLAAGVVLCFLKFKEPLSVWMKGISKTIIGAAFLLMLWSDGSLPFPSFRGDSGLFFALYLVCALAWCVLCVLSYNADSEAQQRNNWLSRLLLAAVFVACLTETELVVNFFSVLGRWNMELPTVSLAWWRVALTGVLLVGGSIATYNYDGSCMGPDSLFLGALAGGVVLLRVLMDFGFPFCQVLLLVILVGSLCCFLNEMKGKKTLRLSSPAYLIAQTGAALAAVFLMYHDLWMPLVLLILYGVIFYATVDKMTTPMRRLVWWLTALSTPAALASAFVWQTRLMAAPCVLLAAAYVLFAFVIVILNWPNPNTRTSPNVYKWTVCGFMAVLSVLAALR